MQYCRNILFLLVVFIAGNKFSIAQTPEKCGSQIWLEHYIAAHPEAKQEMAENQKRIDQWMLDHPLGMRGVVTVPVVVHVIWNTASQNISDAQIMSQIDVLNEDYRRANEDTSNTPVPFKPVAADCQIQFCLAAFDLNGNPTTGIVRTQTNVAIFDLDDKMKYTAQGGDDGWDADRYLNIWTCNIMSPFLGYGTQPTTNLGSNDGIVVLYKAFGNQGFVVPPYSKGRTATHEVGHWFNLRHTWDQDGCSTDDGMDDTPKQDVATYGHPSFPVYDNCSPVGTDGIMFMNYMDYTDDGAMNIFTADQAAEMSAVLNTMRSGILTSNAGCNSPQLDVAAVNILEPVDTMDALSFQPVIRCSNKGQQALTYFHVAFKVDDQSPVEMDFTDTIEPGLSTDLTLPLMFTSEGGHVCTAWVLNPNHSNDENHSNDTITNEFRVVSTIHVNTIIITPNPSDGYIHVLIENPSSGDMNLKICNDIGQVMQQHFSSLITESSFDLDLSNLASGIYFFYATIGFDRTTKKIMVMHQ